jgi:hypothetical protein
MMMNGATSLLGESPTKFNWFASVCALCVQCVGTLVGLVVLMLVISIAHEAKSAAESTRGAYSIIQHICANPEVAPYCYS